MITIGVIGASGQVGTEVCLFLKTYPGVRPIGIVRTSISGALLRRLGIEVRVGTFESQDQSVDLLRDCDVIVDFSASSRDVRSMKSHYSRYITQATRLSSPSARYIFISTIDAFGMNARFNRPRYYWVPHTIYAHTKRYGERLAMRMGKELGKDAFVFRLGHVHGLLQRVSAEAEALARGKYRVFEYPSTPSHTIFCHTIAEGIVSVAEGKQIPGIYTLISEPAWSWEDVIRYYADPNAKLEVLAAAPGQRRWINNLVRGIQGWFTRKLLEYKDTLAANLLHRLPRIERKCRAYFCTLKAKQEIGRLRDLTIYRQSGIYSGIFPGMRLPGLSDSRVSMAAKRTQVSEMLDALVKRAGSVIDPQIPANDPPSKQ